MSNAIYGIKALVNVTVRAYVVVDGFRRLPRGNQGQQLGFVPARGTQETEFSLKAGDYRSWVAVLTAVVPEDEEISLHNLPHIELPSSADKPTTYRDLVTITLEQAKT